ncbi:MAG: hypothetical protein U0Q18_00525 [Bryobacteraceae bacterium]
MADETRHKPFCSGGEPAPCKGYFAGDVLPCVCGAEGTATEALKEVAMPAPAGGTPPVSSRGEFRTRSATE